VVGIERSPAALTWARCNAETFAARGADVEVRAGDVLDPQVWADLAGTVDLVTVNPPYVPAGTSVPPEVDADPAEAVFAGADGLDLVRPLVAVLARLVRPGGSVAIEHDDGHGEVVPQLLRDGGFVAVADHPDLAGRPRFATAQWPTFRLAGGATGGAAAGATAARLVP
jgi:release factor glutamine methyltransferase